MQKKLDSIAIILSGICAIHCFLTPFVMVIFPFCTSSCCSEHSNFHQIMAYIVLPLSGFSLFSGCRCHKKVSIFLLGILGLVIIWYCAFWGHSTLSALGERIFTVIGGSILAFAHLCNLYVCKCFHRIKKIEKVSCC